MNCYRNNPTVSVLIDNDKYNFIYSSLKGEY